VFPTIQSTNPLTILYGIRYEMAAKVVRCEQASVLASSILSGSNELRCLSCKPVLLLITPDVETWQPRLTVLVVLFLLGNVGCG
jgi:hypothetical protein